MKNDSDKGKEELQFQPKSNATFLSIIAPDSSDFKKFGKSCGH